VSESARRQGAIGPGRTGEVVDFQDAGDKRVETTGDFSLTPEEVNSVLITYASTASTRPRCACTCWTIAGNPKYGVRPMPLGSVQGYFRGVIVVKREGGVAI